jgi:hypothetical protein
MSVGPGMLGGGRRKRGNTEQGKPVEAEPELSTTWGTSPAVQ